ncbi:MAG TPA: hypothetical protein VEK79_06960 [Thermoanaerobaculia bacterium]|nr:hypothetical protein [Thermoanaerobaculia bacterium]
MPPDRLIPDRLNDEPITDPRLGDDDCGLDLLAQRRDVHAHLGREMPIVTARKTGMMRWREKISRR